MYMVFNRLSLNMNMLIIKNIKLLVVYCSDTKDSRNLGAFVLIELFNGYVSSL
jgi:hypothetical protein